ncbi:loricrin, putative [Trichomonas vaginalis G3]|uniref:receptor protein-tyrosine kinase n=1 Tax=Trichomonas vaginalis (strain ATCC PRA-98 / G3) TaxID=412133 RepID=A2FF32_TRIV3|nr:glycine-rich protein family [Trichomonas vaginalis G3]EAX96490.1 loricrin, putative [Trichomonas vaginalis G3]KAI5552099.1 glycine-rich protein family [Trichomonas vaginalis G3]|eukprot:XP_001309420.1 loricrin [Trichomonas vaginalis G3]
MYLYLGGRGEDQSDMSHSHIPVSGGWNFGGKGGNDYHNDLGGSYPTESGAGGGGGVDLRLEYYDINQDEIDENLLNKSLESRIIVAGSGGGGCSERVLDWGFMRGFPGGNISAISNGLYVFGGNQIQGLLGKGMNGTDGPHNEGGSGGCGSGYHGGYTSFPPSTRDGIFSVGGSGGSSFISGHFGCISPYFKNDTEPTPLNSFHESGLYFTETVMKSGNEDMPSPYDDSIITGHIGHGVCRITILRPKICPSFNFCFSIPLSLLFAPLGFSIKS